MVDAAFASLKGHWFMSDVSTKFVSTFLPSTSLAPGYGKQMYMSASDERIFRITIIS